jgi:hypothetical protein
VGGDYDLPQRFVTVVSPRQALASLCGSSESSREQWRIEAGTRVWLLDLTKANRLPDPTVIRCTPAEEVGK